MARKQEGIFQSRPGHTEIETRCLTSETESHGLESTQITPRGVPVIPDTMNKPGIVAMTEALSEGGTGRVSAEDLFARKLDVEV